MLLEPKNLNLSFQFNQYVEKIRTDDYRQHNIYYRDHPVSPSCSFGSALYDYRHVDDAESIRQGKTCVIRLIIKNHHTGKLWCNTRNLRNRRNR